MKTVLLDTCALIWFAEGVEIAAPAVTAIVEAALSGGIFVSPVSAWEISLLCSAGRFPHARTTAACEHWFARFVARQGVHTAAFTPTIAFASTSLPGLDHRDPADRFLIATARSMGMPIVTRDRVILSYGQAGHVQCLPC